MDKAQHMLNQAQVAKPHVKYVLNDKRNIIGAWSSTLNRYVCVASLSLTGEWVSMPYELLVNGEPMQVIWVDKEQVS